MQAIEQSLQLLMNLSKVNSVLSRKLTLHGLSFTDFMILYLVDQSAEGKMRRIDLADKIGLTASGVTRMLVPLEKIGVVKREANERDARVSFVMLTPAGQQLLEDAMVTANHLAKEIIPAAKVKKAGALMELLGELGGNIA
jgi:DNA-binding MarR family transcriptional regulator